MINQYDNKMKLKVLLADNEIFKKAAFRLRYQVFKDEIGAKIDNDQKLDIDDFDFYCDHLVVLDEQENIIVGTYRLLNYTKMIEKGGWYSSNEFDLSNLAPFFPQTVEIGRACIDKNYRNGSVLLLLWTALINYMFQYDICYMIGCGSVSLSLGRDYISNLSHELSEKYLTLEEYEVKPLIPYSVNDIKQEYSEIEYPSLINGYLKLGAKIGGKPALDSEFNTADFFLFLDRSNINPRYLKRFIKE